MSKYRWRGFIRMVSTVIWTVTSTDSKVTTWLQDFIIESQSEWFKLFLPSWGTMLLILCFLTSWAVAVTSVLETAFSRKKDAYVVWRFQCVVLFFVTMLLFLILIFGRGLFLPISIGQLVRCFGFNLLLLLLKLSCLSCSSCSFTSK